jgi:hypothetical protein
MKIHIDHSNVSLRKMKVGGQQLTAKDARVDDLIR